MVISLIGATIVVFGLAHAKDDPINVFIRAEGYAIGPEQIAALRAKWGLDRPLILPVLDLVGQYRSCRPRPERWYQPQGDGHFEGKVAGNDAVGGRCLDRRHVCRHSSRNSFGDAKSLDLGLFPASVCAIGSISACVLGGNSGHLDFRCVSRVVAGTDFLWKNGCEFLGAVPVFLTAGLGPRLGADRWVSTNHAFGDARGNGLGVHQAGASKGHGLWTSCC